MAKEKEYLELSRFSERIILLLIALLHSGHVKFRVFRRVPQEKFLRKPYNKFYIINKYINSI